MKYNPNKRTVIEHGVVTAIVQDFYGDDADSERFHAELAKRINAHDELVRMLELAIDECGNSVFEAEARAALAKAGVAC